MNLELPLAFSNKGKRHFYVFIRNNKIGYTWLSGPTLTSIFAYDKKQALKIFKKIISKKLLNNSLRRKKFNHDHWRRIPVSAYQIEYSTLISNSTYGHTK